MKLYLDDIFMILGCVLILIGTFQLSHVATWFVAGGMCIAFGILAGLGGSGTEVKKP